MAPFLVNPLLAQTRDRLGRASEGEGDEGTNAWIVPTTKCSYSGCNPPKSKLRSNK